MWINNCVSVITSADGPIIAPAYVAVRHSETADALGALQLVAFIAGEMHRGSPPGDTRQRRKNVWTAKLSWKKKPSKISQAAAVQILLGLLSLTEHIKQCDIIYRFLWMKQRKCIWHAFRSSQCGTKEDLVPFRIHVFFSNGTHDQETISQ